MADTCTTALIVNAGDALPYFWSLSVAGGSGATLAEAAATRQEQR
ncbi:MAG: hypothetical protein OEN22_03690 [Gammaproteobacteria bacterium]|nr:hypothetical protein [Gammaproteobacteria bacterium]